MAHLTFNFLDVGQGDGTFVVFPDGKKMLVDLGSKKNAKIITQDINQFFGGFWQRGGGPNNKLDLLMLTHGDQDHYNLVVKLVNDFRLDVAEIYIGGQTTDYYVGGFNTGFLALYADRVNRFPSNASNGTNLWRNIGGVNIHILCVNYPSRDDTDTNSKSLVMLLEYKGNKMILGGDATRGTEEEIVRHYTQDVKNPGFLQSDFMKVNHHGSETSSCAKWLRAVKPQYAFVSADMHDKYLLPRCPVINRILTDGKIVSNVPPHPYVCYDHKQDDWFNHDTQRGIFNTLAKYTVTQHDVAGHGVRYIVTFKDDGATDIAHTGFPTLSLPAPASGRNGF